MKITKEVQAQARRLLRLCIGEDGLLQDDVVRYVASSVSAQKPRNYLALLNAFTDLVRLEKARRTATITSAVPLTPAEQSAIRNKLDTRQKGLEYVWATDPSLIGGLIVKVGDHVTDSSLRSRIKRLSLIS